ncbi:MAG: GlcNAc-transferase family protein [Rickettsiales bacterium]
MTDIHQRIFVAIAAYRDPEVSHTLADMFAKAAHPERIFAGITLQFDPEEDAECNVVSDRMEQLRIHALHYNDSKGANWARAKAISLREGEEYILQIDSHMRFEPGWDETLIDMLERCQSEKPIITAYLPNYEPPDNRDYGKGHLLRIRVRKLGNETDPQLLHVTGRFVAPSDTERFGLYPTPFYIANFMFTRAATLEEVPIDPHFHFYGDEISYGARLWTHGYDMFQPDRVVMFHYWVRKDRLHLQHYRNTQTEKSRVSLMRGLHLLRFLRIEDKRALVEIEKYGLGDERPLQGLWEFAGVNWRKRTIAKDATEGIWNMAARKKAIAKKNKTKVDEASSPSSLEPRTMREPAGSQREHPRIFVQVAAYRDPDCQHTIKDMFDKATHPERIFAGIVWQTVKGEDDICFEVPYPRPDQVRVTEVDAKKSRGVCWARSMTQQLWEGEEFTLQIDSHMRFEPGWDETLLGMWDECGNDKAVLTYYPPGFTPPNELQRDWIFGMSAKEFDKNDIFLMRGLPAYKQGNFPDKPMPGAFVAAGCIFGPATIINDVPYDPNIYFFGEEISLAVRLWTSGYDIYYPNKLFIYHDWDRGKRPTHFSDHRDWGKLNDISFARVKHMLGTEKTENAKALKEFEKYGLGTARSLDEYQKFSGVNFANKTISEAATRGEVMRSDTTRISSEVKVEDDRYRRKIFVQIASYRDMECQYTVQDLFAKAKYPDRIFVGICWQFDPEEDKDCFRVSTRPDQVRMLPVDWREADGVCWARNQTQQLWEGEEYTLQIDSHMRFMQGWDELLIEELNACESKKPVLSCSPASYIPPNQLEQNPHPTIRRVHPFFPDGNVRGKGEALDRVPEKPLNAAFVAAGFMFSRSEIIKEVPYDPYLYFDQEEITLAARLYTHGWDVFSSRRPLLYHYYNVAGKPSVRPLHWGDLRKEDEDKIRMLRERGMKRFNHMTGHRQTDDPEALKELEFYGFGAVRTLAQFEEYSGIDFKNKVASEKALRCGFIKGLEKYRNRPIHVPELDGKHRPEQQRPQEARRRPEKPMPTPSATPLEACDFLPMFFMDDTTDRTHSIETHGGKFGILAFLPVDNVEYVSNFLRALHEQLAKAERPDIWLTFIVDGDVEKLKAIKERLKLPQVLTADPDRVIAKSFGVYRDTDISVSPTAFAVNNNLKIISRHSGMAASQLATAVFDDCSVHRAAYLDEQKEVQTFSKMPPALMVPNVFSKEFCARCIEAFETGHTFDGTVGGGKEAGYKPGSKLRTDHVVHGELLREIDDKLSRSLFPEIKKVFGFEVTHREYYKIGLYDGERGGFFKHHRDNFDEKMGYRRIAMTLNLNDDYEGGGLRFPEYDENIYRPKAGSAIAFSSSTMHEARKVTKGKRYVVVGFFHGVQDEAYRQQYQARNGLDLKIADFVPTLKTYPQELKVSRGFYDKWQAENVSYTGGEKTSAAAVNTQPQAGGGLANVMVNTLGGHQPKKVFESSQAIIFDDFLPDDVFERVHNFAVKADYEHINTKGKISRAWHLQDGFPLRSSLNLFHYADGVEKPKADYVYPTNTDMDIFMDHLMAIQPHVEHFNGKMGKDWAHVTATSWLYPHGTGLSMHDDGSGVYTGAYVYFLNRQWKTHWGGLLLMVEEGNKAVYDYREKNDQMEFYHRKWLNANPLDDLLMEHGFARCIFPKKNRIVFIANNAYHMVTRVNESCGDNVRMSFAGFYNRKK